MKFCEVFFSLKNVIFVALCFSFKQGKGSFKATFSTEEKTSLNVVRIRFIWRLVCGNILRTQGFIKEFYSLYKKLSFFALCYSLNATFWTDKKTALFIWRSVCGKILRTKGLIKKLYFLYKMWPFLHSAIV